MRAIVVTGCILALLSFPALGLADWSENFDSYPLGEIIGTGGWDGWDGNAGAGADVTDLHSRSPENSVEIELSSDLVHEYSGYTSGKWFYIVHQYIPSDFSSPLNPSYFIMLSQYVSNDWIWAVQIGFDSTDGMIHCDCGLSPGDVVTVPYVTDEWAEIRVYIDLDEDWLQIYYNGQLLDDPALADHPTLGGGQAWTLGPFGQSAGPMDIASVDLFAYDNSPIYYDDMSLSPATLWADLKVNGSDNDLPGLVAPTDVKINYAVVAGEDDYGLDRDVWVLLKTPLNHPLNWLSFDGDGPIMGWNPGYLNELVSGPMGNYAGVPVDLSGFGIVGDYKAYLAVDGTADGVPNIGDMLIVDDVAFTISLN